MDLGPVVAKMDKANDVLLKTVEDTNRKTQELDSKVDDLKVQLARHEGLHDGLTRDVDRLMRKIFNGGGPKA